MIKLKPFRSYSSFSSLGSAYRRYFGDYPCPSLSRIRQDDIDFANRTIYNKHLDRRLSNAYPVLDRREREKFGIVLLRG